MKKQFFAQKAFIHHDGKLLLVRKSGDDPNQAGKWEVPGGRMDFGEDVEEHLRREVLEEVGLEIVPGKPFHIWQWQLQRPDSTGQIVQIQIVAVARLCTPVNLKIDTSRQVEEDFIDAVTWVAFEKLDSYDWIPNMLPVVASFSKLPEIQK